MHDPKRVPSDWIRQLREGTLPANVHPLEMLQKLADALDPDESFAIFANVDVPEIDVRDDAEHKTLEDPTKISDTQKSGPNTS